MFSPAFHHHNSSASFLFFVVAVPPGVDYGLETYVYRKKCFPEMNVTGGTLVQILISHQLLDGLPFNLVQTFMFLTG